jgi:hypothetical protein
VQAGNTVIVTGTQAFAAVQWALGAILYEKNVAGAPANGPLAKPDSAKCLTGLNKDNMYYYRRQMRCVFPSYSSFATVCAC